MEIRLSLFITLNEHDSGKRTHQARAVGNTNQVLRRLLCPIGARVHPHFRHVGRRKRGVGGDYEAYDKKIEIIDFLNKLS